jgi:hypothetical protein
VKRLRNIAAVIAPPGRPPTLAHVGEVALQRLAVLLVERHPPARIDRGAARRQQLVGDLSSAQNRPEWWWPRAITQAPVRVATSTTTAA